MLESVYEQCLCYEFHREGIAFERQIGIPVIYKGSKIGEGFRADIVVDRQLILEVKALPAILPAARAPNRAGLPRPTSRASQ